MKSCSFFGTVKKEQMTHEFLSCIYRLFFYLIAEKGVTMFFTTAHTEFDFACEDILFCLKESFPDILIEKIAAKNCRCDFSDEKYDRYVTFRDGSYYKRCVYIAKMSDYVIFDSISAKGMKGEVLFQVITETHPKAVFDIERIIKKNGIIEEGNHKSVNLLN